MQDAPMTYDLIGPSYYDDPYYQSEHYKAKLAFAYATEDARQSLQRKESTPEALAYARFLNAVENDATMAHGVFKSFSVDEDEVLRDFPFLATVSVCENNP